MLRTATPRDRPPASSALGEFTRGRLGLTVAAAHVALPRSEPLLTYACTLWLLRASLADDSVKNHHTPAFGAYTRCDCPEWPVASLNVPEIWFPILTGAVTGGVGSTLVTVRGTVLLT